MGSQGVRHGLATKQQQRDESLGEQDNTSVQFSHCHVLSCQHHQVTFSLLMIDMNSEMKFLKIASEYFILNCTFTK